MKRRVKDIKAKPSAGLEFTDLKTHGWEVHSSPLRGKMPILFGHRSIEAISSILEQIQPDNIFLISDHTVYDLHAKTLLENLPLKQEVREILIHPGEGQKNLANLEQICQRLFQTGANRNSVVLNFGGGVLLNIGGLAASLIYRGVRFIQIPTTLLAQSDVIVSNKQTINFADGKNRLGVFSTPDLTIVDTQWLKTEPPIQIYSALVEYCKNAIILGGAHYERALELIGHCEISESFLENIVKESLAQKFVIGKKDPFEKKGALILEYGHTAGHALEYLSEEKLLHGEAVYHGMKIAGALSHKMGLLPAEELKKQTALLDLLPEIRPIPPGVELSHWMQSIRMDNKKSGEQIKFILLEKIGKPHLESGSVLTDVDPELLENV